MGVEVEQEADLVWTWNMNGWEHGWSIGWFILLLVKVLRTLATCREGDRNSRG